MTKLATKLGDRVLGMLLTQRTAGACVANWNHTCGCAGRNQKLIDCNGVCRRTQILCS